MVDTAYFDYAATTPMCQASKKAMIEALDIFANPSSAHRYGQKSRVLIEQSRAIIADLLHCSRSNIVFCSGATEAINLGIRAICEKILPKSIITSDLEHLSVLRSCQHVSEQLQIPLLKVRHNHWGDVDLEHLDELLQGNHRSLVCLMHANNETGNLLPIKEVGKLCKKHHCFFFCDMVQTIGKFDIDIGSLPIDFGVASAHKFYGSKGAGLFFLKEPTTPLLYGGQQERNLRAGTENIAAIAAMTAALQESYLHLQQRQAHLKRLKEYCINQLISNFKNIHFIGNCQNGGLYNMLNFQLTDQDTDNLFMLLDIASIAVSSGSACSSGSNHQSHVLRTLGYSKKSLRLSFGTDNTTDQIDYLITTLKRISNR